MKSARKNKSAKNSSALVPKIFRKPMIPAGILLILDVLTLAAAVVLNIFRDSFKISCRLGENTVIESSPYSGFGIAAAVLVFAAAAVTAVLIAGSVMRNKAARGDMAFEIAAAALLLALSAGISGFAFCVVRGEQPVNKETVGFSDETNCIVFVEEEYRSENLLKIYISENGSSEEGTPCKRVVCVPLAELTEGDFEERYTMNSISEDVVQISFMDGVNYRTFEITIE